MKLTRKPIILTLLLSITILIGQAMYTTPPAYAAVDCNAVGIICKSGVLNSNETWTSGNVYILVVVAR